MSNVYIHEPATTGKVLLHTSHGPLEVELWCKECPKACRNFIQLGLEGYYEATPFHRLLPGFIVQGGDPTGTGTGGESIYGKPFPIEAHSRIKFGRRGLLAMAVVNNEAGENGSQFFFTLGPTPELDGKATLFGKIVGDTIFNLLRIGELEVDDASERPLFPAVVSTVEILMNPFDDIVPRELAEVQARRAALQQRVEPKTKTKAAAIKNKKLLSFEHDEEETDKVSSAKIKSSHDVLNDPTLSKALAVDPTQLTLVRAARPQRTHKATPEQDGGMDEVVQLRNQRLNELKSSVASVEQSIRSMDTSAFQDDKSRSGDKEKRIDSVSQFLGRKTKPASAPALSPLEQLKQAYTKKPKTIVGRRVKSHADEVDVLLRFNSFQETLHSMHQQEALDPVKAKAAASQNPELPPKQMDICKLHGLVNCLSCRDTFGLQEEGTEEGWLMHRLVFDKEAGYRDVREDLRQLEVIDPREKARELLGRKP